ncbi:MAG: catalase-related domain-containing protein [Candidatus Binataceae bacterium]
MVNRPHASSVSNDERDGVMRFDNPGRAKNYEPNSFGGPIEGGKPLWTPREFSGIAGSQPPPRYPADNDFVQAGDLYRLMSAEERERLVANIAGSLARVNRADIIERAVGHFSQADPDYGARVEKAVAALRESVR